MCKADLRGKETVQRRGRHVVKENTFYREHILERTHSIENTFYREHILERTHSRENTFYRGERHLQLTLFYREHILQRTHSIENTFYRGRATPVAYSILQRTPSIENTFYREHLLQRTPSIGGERHLQLTLREVERIEENV